MERKKFKEDGFFFVSLAYLGDPWHARTMLLRFFAGLGRVIKIAVAMDNPDQFLFAL